MKMHFLVSLICFEAAMKAYVFICVCECALAISLFLLFTFEQ